MKVEGDIPKRLAIRVCGLIKITFVISLLINPQQPDNGLFFYFPPIVKFGTNKLGALYPVLIFKSDAGMLFANKSSNVPAIVISLTGY